MHLLKKRSLSSIPTLILIIPTLQGFIPTLQWFIPTVLAIIPTVITIIPTLSHPCHNQALLFKKKNSKLPLFYKKKDHPKRGRLTQLISDFRIHHAVLTVYIIYHFYDSTWKSRPQHTSHSFSLPSTDFKANQRSFTEHQWQLVHKASV
jgi:hypothetical protein